MSRQRKVAVAILSAVALVTACELAHAQPNEPAAEDATSAPAYTLEVDSDAPDVISYEALAARIASDLGGTVARPGKVPAWRVAITVRYRDHELAVRAVHPGGRVLERTVKAEGDDAAVQREAVLLAANLARDEARELLDVLAARPAPSAPAPAPAPAAKPAEPPADEGYQAFSAAFFSPIATNYELPNVRSNFNLSILYGRVGTIDGMQFGSGVVYASRAVDGAQLAGAVALSAGPVDGAQISGAYDMAEGKMSGAQLSGGANVALKDMWGAQVTGAANVVRGTVRGLQLSGAANVATGAVDGAQLSSVNVAGPIDGAQVGVINIARKVRGAQVGVINVAEEVDGAAIGLVSISKDSIHPIAWTSNLQYMNAGIKFTTKYMYTLVGVHYGTLEGDFDNIGTTAAIGGHIPLPAGFDIEIQNAMTHLIPRPSQSTKDGNLWIAYQAMAGYSFASHLRVFAGGGARQPLLVDLGREVVRPEVLAGVQF